MKNFFPRLWLIILTMFGCATFSFGADHSLPNFHEVNKHVYRGAQPGLSELRELRQMGIRTIINLRGEGELSQAEEKEARSLGLQYFGFPLRGFNRPTREQVAQVLALIDDEKNWPAFVHCKRGADRTGTIIACYRISHDHWTAEQALDEARRYGLHWTEFGMKDFIKDYFRDFGTKQTADKSYWPTQTSRPPAYFSTT